MEDFSKYNNEGTTLRKAQLRMLDILIDVDKICRKHNIAYWLDFGTLLGAVRHGGFIPWDDDLDICMPSESYKRFIEIAPKELNRNYCLQTDETTPDAVAIGKGLCQIRDKNSIFINDYDDFRKSYQKGIFVDIYESVDMPRIPNGLFTFLSRRISFAWGFFHYNKPLNLKNIVCYFVYPFSCLFFGTIWKISLLGKTKNKMFTRPERYVYGLPTLKKDIFPLTEIEFEKHLFFAPANSDARLKDSFGDYMQIPPENKRRIHAKFIWIQ